MIRFNANGKVAKFDNDNVFWAGLPDTRKIMFKRAFGLLPEKSPVLRFQRDKDGAAIKGAEKNYQETLLEARKYVQDILETQATLVGASLSQVVHAITSGNVGALIAAIDKRNKATITQSNIKVWDTGLQDWKTKVHFDYGLPSGHRYKGNPHQLKHEDIEKVVLQAWRDVAGILTKKEQALEGGEAAVHKLQTEERAKKKTWTTSKKNAMKGVQVVNKRQKARTEAVTGA